MSGWRGEIVDNITTSIADHGLTITGAAKESGLAVATLHRRLTPEGVARFKFSELEALGQALVGDARGEVGEWLLSMLPELGEPA